MRLDFCVSCGTKENLHHHHLFPRVLGGSDEETNLITLCEFHHGLAHGSGGLFHAHKTLVVKGSKKSKEQGVRFGNKNDRLTLECLLEHTNIVMPKYLPALVLFSYGYYVNDILDLKWKHLDRLPITPEYKEALIKVRPENANKRDFIYPSEAVSRDRRENSFSVYKNRLINKIENPVMQSPPATAEDLRKIHFFLKTRRNETFD